MSRFFRILFLLLYSAQYIACSTADKTANTAEGLFNIAKELEDNEHYELAIPKYQDVKNKFPYSSFSTKSELAIANIYFKRESFAEAQVAYQAFKELHPKYVEIDFVQYRIGMSYFNQLPSTIDRDLSLAKETISSFDYLIRNYPKSSHVQEATEKKSSAVQMLAQKEEYIADFYFKKSKYESALGRYEGLYQNYSGVGLDAKALARAALCAHKIGQKNKFQKYRSLLKQKFSSSPYYQDLLKERLEEVE